MAKSTENGSGKKKTHSLTANELVGGMSKRLLATPKCAYTLLIAFVLFAATAASAQVLYGSLTGTVTDITGAVVPNAQVTALEAQTGVSQTATADSDGIYRFPTLLPVNPCGNPGRTAARYVAAKARGDFDTGVDIPVRQPLFQIPIILERRFFHEIGRATQFFEIGAAFMAMVVVKNGEG